MVLEILRINSIIKSERPEYEQGTKLVDVFISELGNMGLYPQKISENILPETSPKDIQPDSPDILESTVNNTYTDENGLETILEVGFEVPDPTTKTDLPQKTVDISDLIMATQGAKEMKISRMKMAELIKRGIVTAHVNPYDRRQKLVSRTELQNIRPIPEQ